MPPARAATAMNLLRSRAAGVAATSTTLEEVAPPQAGSVTSDHSHGRNSTRRGGAGGGILTLALIASTGFGIARVIELRSALT
jgi:hypothetical protein